MRESKRFSRGLLLAGLLFLFASHLQTNGVLHASEGGTARSFLVSLDHLDLVKQDWLRGDPGVKSDVDRVISRANKALTLGPYSVLNSPEVAPSGDPHDLLSYGYYSWPNPNTADGTPWIRRDGHGNPNSQLDWDQFYGLARAVEPLSVAYYLTDDERYGEKMASLFRTWFLDEETRMNPRDLYSSVIPGRSPGSFATPGFGNALGGRRMIDAMGIVEASPSWTETDEAGLKQWTRDFTVWAETHRFGEVQRNEPSNHGTNYDFMFTAFGLYNGDLASAEKNYLNYVNDRMLGQIAEDGSNPLEMLRANNRLYHRYNINRAMELAAVGRGLGGVDLFDYETEDGRSLRLALDYFLPYMLGDKEWDKWPGEEFPLELSTYYMVLRSAAVYFADPTLLEQANRLPFRSMGFINVTHPESAVYASIWTGDANVDGEFTSEDLVMVLQAGKYEEAVNAGWADGDWNQDRRFDSADLINAFAEGGYEQGPFKLKSPRVVPEPSTLSVLGLALLCIFSFRKAVFVTSLCGRTY